MGDLLESKEFVTLPLPNITDGDNTVSIKIDNCLSANHQLSLSSSLSPSTSDFLPTYNSKDHPCQPDTSGRKRKKVQFSNVIVYHFSREQGFCSIPDNGWCSLGMSQKHCSVSRYDIHHHQLIQRIKRKRRHLSANHSNTGVVPARLRGRTRMPVVDEFYPTRDTCRVPQVNSPPLLSPQPTCDRSFGSAMQNAVQSTPPPPCLSPPSPRRVLANLADCLYTPSLQPLDSLDTDSETSLDRMPTLKRSQKTRVKARQEKIMPMHAAARIRLLKESGD